MTIKRLIIATSLLCASISMAVTLKNDAPQHYIVQPGDSLWNLAKKYTDDPWAWRQLWKQNPQVNNPNRIYPGDELTIVEGKIAYKRNFKGNTGQQGGLKTVKLTPEMREVPIELGLPVISYDYLRGQLVQMEIMQSADLKSLPYIVAFEDNRITGHTNMKAFIKGDLVPGKVYDVYDRGETHYGTNLDDIKKGKNSKKNIEIGTELIKTGEVVVENSKDGVSTVYIKDVINRGLAQSQLLIEHPPADKIGNLFFEPKSAPQKTETQVVSTPGMLQSVAIGGTVVLNQGLDAGLSTGDLLLAQQADIYKADPMNPSNRIRIPGQAAGMVMVYKVFDRMSLGIVIETIKPIQKGMMAVTPYSDYLTH